MPGLTPSDPIVKAYLKDLQHLKQQQVVHELGLKGPFQNLLDKAAKRRGWTLVPELATHSGGRRVVPGGAVRDQRRIARGWWEAKDTSDNLDFEIEKKLRAGYPARNTIFEDTQRAVLFQGRSEAGEFNLIEPVHVVELLNRFFSHDESDGREFQRAITVIIGNPAYNVGLGSRSALEWIIDQYRAKGDSDPNREDDPGYIARLVRQVVRVSVETVGIVKSLPNFLA